MTEQWEEAYLQLRNKYPGNFGTITRDPLSRQTAQPLARPIPRRRSKDTHRSRRSYRLHREVYPAQVPTLIAILKDKNSKVADAAVVALGQVGPDAKAALPALVDMLGHFLKSDDAPKAMMVLANARQKDENGAVIVRGNFRKDQLPGLLAQAIRKIDPATAEVLPAGDVIFKDDQKDAARALKETRKLTLERGKRRMRHSRNAILPQHRLPTLSGMALTSSKNC